MEIFFIKALQLILCFCILILLHEGGHFFFAKLFKTRVEKFYLFFNPKFHIFSTYDTWFRRLIGKAPVPEKEVTDENGNKHKEKEYVGTEYGLGWLPLGGYCAISGMVDESMNTEQMKQPEQPWEFRAKPAWQRLLIMAGGVMVNFVLALFIYAMILFVWGDTYTPIKDIAYGFKYNESAQQLGFRDGDIPLRTDAQAFDRFTADVFRDLSEAKSVTVLRDGHEVTFSLPGDLNLLDMLQSQPVFMAPLSPSVIDSVLAGTPADLAGIRKGDRLIGLNGKALSTWNEFDFRMNDLQSSIAAYRKEQDVRMADSLSRITVVVQHAVTDRPDTLAVTLNAEGMMGIVKQNALMSYPTVTRTYGFWESFPAGIAHGWEVLCGYVDDLKYLFTADGAKSIGSFGTIGSLFPASWDWLRFWELTAFISLMLAFVNFLPIPALDGGHIFFLLCEVVTRRKLSTKFMERAQMVGMWFLFALMAYAIFNDFARFVF